MSRTFGELRSVAEFVNGAAFKPEDWGESGARIIRIQNLTDTTKPFNRTTRVVPEKVHVRPGDLLVSWSASLGVFEWNEPDVALLNQHIFRVIPDNSKVDKRYLRYGLELALRDMQRHLHGATMQHVNRDEFLSTRIYLPPLLEQRRIAAILDKADELRAKRRAALERLNGLTQSVFIEMFGDPATNPKRWPNPLLGGTITFQQYGPRFFNEPYNANGIRIARITDLNEDGRLDFTGMPRLDVSNEDRQKYQLKPGDLLFARSGATVGKVALIRPDDPPCIAGAYFITMRFQDVIEPAYARAVLASTSVRAIVTRRSRQAAQQNFSGPGLRGLPMPIPPIALQQRFADLVAAIENLTNGVMQPSMSHLDDLFSSLQLQAFSGAL